MRVTIVSRIFGPEPSAASYLLGAIADRLLVAGHDVTVLTARPPRGATISDRPGLSVRRAPVLRDRSGYVRGYLPYLSFDVPAAFRMLFKRRADLYLIEPPPTTGAVARVITALLRRPYLYDAADVWSDAAQLATRSKLVLGLLRRVELFALRGAAHAVTISTGVVDRFRELGVTTPTTVIGFGADTAVFHHLPHVPPAAPSFVYAGTFSEWHGADILLEAFARFTKRHAGATLLFVGNGSDRERLEARVAELGLAGVSFRDPVPGAELADILAGATASLATLKPKVGYDYAFTSKVYSSFAVGCPVVFSGPGPTIDFLAEAERSQRSGIAVPYDAGAIAAALEQIAASPLDDAERRALSEWTTARYSLQAIGDRVVEVAERLVAERTR